jgi:hypothetical protein
MAEDAMSVKATAQAATYFSFIIFILNIIVKSLRYVICREAEGSAPELFWPTVRPESYAENRQVFSLNETLSLDINRFILLIDRANTHQFDYFFNSFCAVRLGFNLAWFGIQVAVNLQTTRLSPLDVDFYSLANDEHDHLTNE